MKRNFYVILISIVLVAVIVITVNSFIKRKSLKTADDVSLTALYNDAKELESKGLYQDAKEAYSDLLEDAQDEGLIQKINEDLMGLNMKILFSPIITEDSVIYTVKKGDTLSAIAKRFNTTAELIKRSNNLESDLISIGKRLKISTAKYSVIVDRSQNILILRSDSETLKIYNVSTGINDSTPLGTFKIINKLIDPVWYKAGAIVPSGSPDNILGTRWMGISLPGYGIHGTTQPESIGKHITAGCVRMVDTDAQELYSILTVGTEVTIVD